VWRCGADGQLPGAAPPEIVLACGIFACMHKLLIIVNVMVDGRDWDAARVVIA
jgi:hypothetical protein